MTDQRDPLDAEAFHRTSTLFLEKSKVLAPEAVEELAQDIVRRLSGMKRTPNVAPDDLAPASRIAAFCDALVQPTPSAALSFILDRQAEGADRHVLLYGYLAGAARMLGARWDADENSFYDVIHGTGHLYALMRALWPDREREGGSAFNRRNALFALVPGETHSFGVTVAAETFREAGWRIDLQIGLDQEALVQHVRLTEPAIIGLSLSTQDRLAALIRLVVALRLVRPQAIIGVAPAIDMSGDVLHRVVDIDAVFRDARAAVRDLDWMLQLRV
ncbi:cobalamin-binding protein [Tabrizicola sp. TH137]|uniref:cobalamin B12-binding domain-containing protein n=1 Tax=Tabrizicola sp. TH137 TaxID=2067452 RepID=UPI000C7AFD05|nr:cobalamin B12-binding domain-containing protein [Tabrizicola sp. TH137]PLL10624.1 cobalamin-binding protein [Tabrizicola sp. TH137]